MHAGELVLDANGLRLRALVLGSDGPALPEGAGEPREGAEEPRVVAEEPRVVLLHATSFCADVWAPVWRAALAAGAVPGPAIAFDTRGHGRSDAPEDPAAYAWTRLVEDALCCAEAVAGSRGVVLVGHSSGATAALVAAALRPDLVRAVAAIEPVLFDAPPPGADADSFPGSRAMAARARKRRPAFADRHEARVFLGDRFPYAGFASATLEAFLAGGLVRSTQGGVELRCRPAIEAAHYDGAAALDLAPLWHGLAPPTLLIAAEHSAISPGPLARLAAAASGLERVSIPGATHFVALEQPELVGRMLGRFLASAPGDRS